jgi:hypothetical protein
MSWGITFHLVPGEYKYGDLAFRVGGVSNETRNMFMNPVPLKPEGDCTANHRPVVSSGVLLHTASFIHFA